MFPEDKVETPVLQWLILWVLKGNPVRVDSNFKFYNGTEEQVRKEVEQIVKARPTYSVSYYEPKGVCSVPAPEVVWK